jgi:hypothetical protein
MYEPLGVTLGGVDGSAEPVPEDEPTTLDEPVVDEPPDDSPGALELPEDEPGEDAPADDDPAEVVLPAGVLVSEAEPPPEQPATSAAAAINAVTAASGRRPRIRDTGCLLE